MNASSPAASGSVDKDGVEDESESYSFVRKWGSEEQMTVNFSEPVMLILTLQKNISLLWIEMVIVSKCSIRMGHFFLSGVQKVLMIANLMYPTAWMLMLMVMFGSLDRGNDRIQKFDIDGNFIFKFGSIGYFLARFASAS
jgi:hypothetical protein